MLARIGLEAAEWERLRKAYRWLPYSLGEDDRRAYFDGLDDAAIYRLVLPPRWRAPDDAAPRCAPPGTSARPCAATRTSGRSRTAAGR
ncbi:hypothetical protein WJ972_13545 [Achromobacter insuavis]